jgi:hypothetical protein
MTAREFVESIAAWLALLVVGAVLGMVVLAFIKH